MRCAIASLFLVLPAVARAQSPEAIAAVETKQAALKFVADQRDGDTGGYRPDPRAKVGMRATSSAVRTIKYLGGKLPDPDRTAAFVLACYDPKTGGFAEPDRKPDVATTGIGVMAAVELNIPREKYAKAMDYLKENANDFEGVRIGAAAVEAWGVKECPFDLAPWFKIAEEFARQPFGADADGGARGRGSLAAFYVRLGRPLAHPEAMTAALRDGQRPDGGWNKVGANASDAESTYRVMRALMLLKEKPKDPAKLRGFLASCRNPDGGFGTKPGETSSVSGVYYAAVVTKWLDAMEK